MFTNCIILLNFTSRRARYGRVRYGRRYRGRTRRLGFNKRVERTVTKMNGLQVYQQSKYYGNQFLQQPAGTQPVNPNAGGGSGPTVITICTPNQFKDWLDFIPVGITALDTKVYIRQLRLRGVMCNNSNTPIYVERLKFVVRKNIPTDEFTSYAGLFTADGNPSTVDPLVDITTANTAQRYLKWLGKKIVYMPCGSMRSFKLNKKWAAPKLVNRQIEGDPTVYFALKGEFGYAFKVTPFIQTQYSGTPATASAVGGVWGSWLLNFKVMEYYSGYQLGNNDPKSSYVAHTIIANSSRLFVPSDQQFTNQSTSGSN